MKQHVAPVHDPPSSATRSLGARLRPSHGRAVAFDLETTGAHRLWTDPVGTHVRIAGYAVGGEDVRLTQNINLLVDGHLRDASTLAGHNIMAYDLLALHRHHGFPTPVQLLGRGVDLHDTQLTEALLDPPESRWSSAEAARHYKLDEVATRHGFGGKSLDLRKLAQHYKRVHKETNPDYNDQGFDLIPLDNPDFLHYLRQDVVLTRLLAQRQRRAWNDYVTREHQVAAIASQITLNGFRVDTKELAQRVEAGRTKRAKIIQELHERYNLPLEDKKGKPYKAPASTKEGKLAIVTAFDDAGVPVEEFKLTAKGTNYDLSQDHMKELAERYAGNERVQALTDAVMSLNGIRSIYENVQDHLAGGRVHPNITLRQASGRWSITNPGMTVVGKRSGRVVEREIFLAEPGEVILTVDLSQVDARAVAAFCQDDNYMDLFEEGRDLWTEMAKRFGMDRDQVKVVGHGTNYSMGINGLLRHYPWLDRNTVERFFREREEQFPGLIRWQNEVREIAGSGQLLDNGWGRKLRVNPERAYTQGPALMGQSAARDIMCHGLLRLDPALHEYLRTWVHDELVLSVPKHSAIDISEEVKGALSFPWAPPGANRPVQIRAEATIGGPTWASAYAKE